MPPADTILQVGVRRQLVDREGLVEIVAQHVRLDAHAPRHHSQKLFYGQSVEQQVLLGVCLFHGRTEHDVHAGQHLDGIGMAAMALGAFAHVVAEGLGAGNRVLGGEHHISETGRLIAACGRGAGIEDHRPALRRTDEGQGAANLEILTDIVDRVDLVGIGEAVVFLVVDKGVRLPALPQLDDHVEEFVAALVAVFRLRMRAGPEHFCGDRMGGRHRIPADAALGEMVD